jgi:hypothetical protein
MLKVAGILLVLGLTSCSAASGQPAATKAAAPAPTFADAQCPLVLSQIPAHPPATTAQATAIVKGLSVDQGIGAELKSETLLKSLSTTVSVDALKLSFDMTGLSANASADLATYNSDVAQLRQYCAG